MIIIKNKKFILKIIFVIAILAIIVYTFRDSAEPIAKQLVNTAPIIVIMICVASVVYHLFEGGITFLLARVYNPKLKLRTGVACAFYTSFYRVATLGSGSGVAAVYFLWKHGVDYSRGTGMYMIQYVLHKISIAAFSAVFFILNWQYMSSSYEEYKGYLILGYVITALIAVVLIIVCYSEKIHRLILWLAKFFNRSGKLDQKIESLTNSLEILAVASKELFSKKKLIAGVFLLDLLKVACWYIIPFLILIQTAPISVVDSLAVTSLTVMLAAVIPTPAGIGSTEFIYVLLFTVIVGVEAAGTSMLLYRFSTFVFPFVIGMIIVLLYRKMQKGKPQRPGQF